MAVIDAWGIISKQLNGIVEPTKSLIDTVSSKIIAIGDAFNSKQNKKDPNEDVIIPKSRFLYFEELRKINAVELMAISNEWSKINENIPQQQKQIIAQNLFQRMQQLHRTGQRTTNTP